RLHVLAPFQEFQKSHSVGRAITPRTGMAVAFLDWTNRFLPIEAGLDRVAFDIIAARKAQKFWIQVHQHLQQVLAKTIRLVVPSRREKRDHAQPDGSR